MKRISTEDFDKAYSVLANAFIPEEIKSYPRLLSEFMTKGLQIFTENDKDIIGVITCWEFENFVFVENFAVVPQKRGCGIGTQLINGIISHFSGKSIILEVEEPDSDTRKRRVEFYEKCGFTLSDTAYLQPALRDKPSEINLRIMHTNTISKALLTAYKEEIFATVYGDYDAKYL